MRCFWFQRQGNVDEFRFVAERSLGRGKISRSPALATVAAFPPAAGKRTGRGLNPGAFLVAILTPRLASCSSPRHDHHEIVVVAGPRFLPIEGWLARKDSNLRSPDPEDSQRSCRSSVRLERGAGSDSVNPPGNQVEHGGRGQVNVRRSSNSGWTVSGSTIVGKGSGSLCSHYSEFHTRAATWSLQG